MIYVTKLNGKEFIINAFYIENVEETPDTLITLTTGKKYLVQETAKEVLTRAKSFYKETSLLQGAAKTSTDAEKD